MKEEEQPSIAGFPPYERGYRAMGYAQGVPPLRVVQWYDPLLPLAKEAEECICPTIADFTVCTHSFKSIVTEEILLLPSLLSLPQLHRIYLKAEAFQNEKQQALLKKYWQPNSKTYFLLSWHSDAFECIEQLRGLRTLSATLPQGTKLPITCWIHQPTEQFYALSGQADDLICELRDQQLISPEIRWLVRRSLVTQTTDPFAK